MNPVVLGLDTSNYRTSMALVSWEGEILLNLRELLPVRSYSPQRTQRLGRQEARRSFL